MGNAEGGFTPKDIDDSEFREEYVKNRELRADTHNKYFRSRSEKLTGRGKVTEKDIAHEEALTMDEQIEQRLESGKATTREEALNQVELLNASKSNAQDFNKLKDHFERYDKMTPEEIDMLIDEIKENAFAKMITSMDSGTYYFVKARDEMVEAGIMSKEEANSLPEVQKMAQLRLENKMDSGTYYFVKARDEMVEAGIDVTVSEKVIRIAKIRLDSAKSRGEYYHDKTKQELMDAGFSIEGNIKAIESPPQQRDWMEFLEEGSWTAMTNFDPSAYEWRGEETSKKIDGMIAEYGEENVMVGPEYDFDNDEINSSKSESAKKCIYIRRETSESTEE